MPHNLLQKYLHPYSIKGFSGTVLPYPYFNARSDAEAIEAAIVIRRDCEEKERFERSIIEILTHRSNVQRQQICLTYRRIYKKDMLEELKLCLSGDFQDAVEAMVSDPVVYDCRLIHRALFEGLTIDGELLAEVLCSRTNVQLMAIQEKYAQLYGDPNEKIDNGQPQALINDVTKIFMESRLMSDRENAVTFVKNVLIDPYHREWSPKMSPADRDEITQWDERLARSDAGELYGAGEFKWGTDEGGFINVLFQQNVTFAQLRATFDAYKRLYNKELVDVVNDEFSGVLKELISVYIECIESRCEYFAKQMYEAMRGLGTDDDTLIRIIVCRCEVDMVQIKLCYKDAFGKTCKEAIDDDTSGTYGDLLLAMVGEGP